MLNQNYILSDEGRKNISKTHKGKIVSQETRKKLSIAQTGKKATNATKNKMSMKKIGELNNSCKIKDKDVLTILYKLKNDENISEIAKEYNVSKTTIYNIKNGKRKINLDN